MATDRAIFAEPNAYSDLEKAITYFRWDDNGYALPNRFEVFIFSPVARSLYGAKTDESKKVSLHPLHILSFLNSGSVNFFFAIIHNMMDAVKVVDSCVHL